MLINTFYNILSSFIEQFSKNQLLSEDMSGRVPQKNNYINIPNELLESVATVSGSNNKLFMVGPRRGRHLCAPQRSFVGFCDL